MKWRLVWVCTRIALSFFLMLEVTVRIFGLEKKPASVFDMSVVPSVSRQSWFSGWMHDHDQLRRNFSAYDLYKLDPYPIGKNLSTDHEGFRRVVGGKSTLTAAPSIGFLGGSTVWGSYARDAYTIPSLFAQMRSSAERVYNFAETGFVFSQEWMRALRILTQKSLSTYHVDTLIFMDGVNDTLAALANLGQGVVEPAGLPWEFQKYRHLFQLGKTEVSWNDLFRKSMAFRIVQDHIFVSKQEALKWQPPTAEQLDVLSTQVAHQYVSSVKAADAAFKSLHVKPIFVLQPLLVYKQHLTPEEQLVVSQNKQWTPYLKSCFEKIKREMLAHPKINYADLSDLFKDEYDLMFSDVLHYTEKANEKIAIRLSGLVDHPLYASN